MMNNEKLKRLDFLDNGISLSAVVLYATVEALNKVINMYTKKGIICTSYHFLYPDFFLIQMIFLKVLPREVWIIKVLAIYL